MENHKNHDPGPQSLNLLECCHKSHESVIFYGQVDLFFNMNSELSNFLQTLACNNFIKHMIINYLRLILICLITVLTFGSCSSHQPDKSTPASIADHQSIIDANTPLIYTKHARCRMSCRHISEADIREVLREGHINEAKSKQEPGKCPTYAIEDHRNSDGVRLRIVFAKCDREVRVVTCIDRDDEFSCDCQ